jgi:hypothetical protein
MKSSKKLLTGILAMVSVLGMALSGCDTGGGGSSTSVPPPAPSETRFAGQIESDLVDLTLTPSAAKSVSTRAVADGSYTYILKVNGTIESVGNATVVSGGAATFKPYSGTTWTASLSNVLKLTSEFTYSSGTYLPGIQLELVKATVTKEDIQGKWVNPTTPSGYNWYEFTDSNFVHQHATHGGTGTFSFNNEDITFNFKTGGNQGEWTPSSGFYIGNRNGSDYITLTWNDPGRDGGTHYKSSGTPTPALEGVWEAGDYKLAFINEFYGLHDDKGEHKNIEDGKFTFTGGAAGGTIKTTQRFPNGGASASIEITISGNELTVGTATGDSWAGVAFGAVFTKH